MKVREMMDLLSKMDSELEVLGEYDSDGDGFMVKVRVLKVMEGNGIDDNNWDDDGKYCIIKLDC
jgi:hypothetical protein